MYHFFGTLGTPIVLDSQFCVPLIIVPDSLFHVQFPVPDNEYYVILIVTHHRVRSF